MVDVNDTGREAFERGRAAMVGERLEDACAEIVELGNTANAYLWLLCPELQEGRLYPGMVFTVQEGNKIVGKGKVKRVINAKLGKNA